MTFIIVVMISSHHIKDGQQGYRYGPGLEQWKAVVLHLASGLKFLGELLRISTLEFYSDQSNNNISKWGLGVSIFKLPRRFTL